jgi:hypothetical protein
MPGLLLILCVFGFWLCVCSGPSRRLAGKLTGLDSDGPAYVAVVQCVCSVVSCAAGPSGRLADKLKGLDNDGLVAPGTIINSGDVTINMQARINTLLCNTIIYQGFARRVVHGAFL